MKNYSFGNFICELRMRRGLSQFQLGTLVGVSDKAVSKWENGRAMPQLSRCQKLSDVLGVSIDDLLACKYQQSTPVEKGVFAMKKVLWEKASSRLTEVYGTVPPVPIAGRFETEKMFMADSDLIIHLGFLSELAAHFRKNNAPFLCRGVLGGSFIAWLLGITEVNPLAPHYFCEHCKTVEFHCDAVDGWDLPPKKCACGHMMYGDGHRLSFESTFSHFSEVSPFDINISPDCCELTDRLLRAYYADFFQVVQCMLPNLPQHTCYALVDFSEEIPHAASEWTWEAYMKEYFHKPRYTFFASPQMKILQELCRATNRTLEHIDFLAKEVLALYERAEFPEFLAPGLRPIVEAYPPACFSDLLKAQGIKHASGKWDGKAFDDSIPFSQQIAFRDDVFDRVLSSMGDTGYTGNGLPLLVMNHTCRARYARRGISPELEALLLQMQIPQEYINSLKKVLYLFPRAHSVAFLRADLMLSWFFVHEQALLMRLVRTHLDPSV